MRIFYGLSAVLLFVMSIACVGQQQATPQPPAPAPAAGLTQHDAQQQALDVAHSNLVYVDRSKVELDNYNQRQRIADDPSTILWCTASFPQPNSPMFTVPIVGKLTSSAKRPYPTTRVLTAYQGGTDYFPELPGPDGMYGSSVEYRYGFTPSGFYVDFYNIATFCTTELTVFQRQSTTVMLAQDNGVNDAQKSAQAVLVGAQASCKVNGNGQPTDAAACTAANAKATQILLDALKK